MQHRVVVVVGERGAGRSNLHVEEQRRSTVVHQPRNGNCNSRGNGAEESEESKVDRHCQSEECWAGRILHIITRNQKTRQSIAEKFVSRHPSNPFSVVFCIGVKLTFVM